MNDNAADPKKTKPPYIPWTTFNNILDEFQGKGLPAQIDRSVLSSKSGATYSQFFLAAKFFGLVDDESKPTDLFKALVDPSRDRDEVIGELVKASYADMLSLGSGATQGQLETKFKNTGLGGETMRKAVAFFLTAAEQGDVPVSSHFRKAKVASGKPAGSRVAPSRKAPKQTKVDPGVTPPTPPVSQATDPKQRYVDLLLKKAEEDMSDELLDRIERVIGMPPREDAGDDA